jgi:hypothetical protein
MTWQAARDVDEWKGREKERRREKEGKTEGKERE